jgi:transcriptional regulator with XRE-family HTH domain
MTKSEYLRFENKLGDIRRSKGISQTMIELATGMPITQISRHENRDYPKLTLRTAYLYALAMGCTIEELFPVAEMPDTLTEWIDEGLPLLGVPIEDGEPVED